MRQRNHNKKRLVRPADALLPLAFLAAGLLGATPLSRALFLVFMMVRLAGLCSAVGLRAAFATQPSARRVRGSVKTALLLQLAGAAAVTCVALLGHARRGTFIMIGLGMLLNVEQVFYEYLDAMGDGTSALMSRAITAILIAAGLIMTGPIDPRHDMTLLSWATGGVAVPTLISAVIALSIGGPLRGRLNAGVLRRAPAAMLQTLIFPCATAVAVQLLDPRIDSDIFCIGFFLGLALFELCRTPFRRSLAESRAMNRALAVVGLACGLAAAPFWINRAAVEIENPATLAQRAFNHLPDIALIIFLAALCAFLTFGRVGREPA